MEYRDYYKVLGVERNATEDEIKRSYRKLALEHHPDRNPGNNSAEDKFKEINEAYQVLSDPEKKGRYDQLGASYKNYTQHGGSPGNFDWEDWFVQNPRGGNARVNVNDFGDIFGNEGIGDFSDFFRSIFGGMAGMGAASRNQVQQKRSTSANLSAKCSDQLYRGLPWNYPSNRSRWSSKRSNYPARGENGNQGSRLSGYFNCTESTKK